MRIVSLKFPTTSKITKFISSIDINDYFFDRKELILNCRLTAEEVEVAKIKFKAEVISLEQAELAVIEKLVLPA
jgi:hypothetical protein